MNQHPERYVEGKIIREVSAESNHGSVVPEGAGTPPWSPLFLALMGHKWVAVAWEAASLHQELGGFVLCEGEDLHNVVSGSFQLLSMKLDAFWG